MAPIAVTYKNIPQMEFRIKFRSFEPEDAHFINRLRRDEAMEANIGGSKRHVSLERDKKWVNDVIFQDSQTVIYFAVTLIDSDEIIGYTSISEIDYRNGTCFWSGIKIDPKFNGQGFGVQIGLRVLKFVFEEMRMERCKGECLEHHSPVIRMLDKIGFVKEGLMRNMVYKNGVQNNQWLLSVVRSDYETIKAKYEI